MLHVFVETNWLVAYAAPAHYSVPAAVRLLDRARSGELRLHLPVICLSEARRPILAKHQSRHADTIRQFLKWAKTHDLVSATDDEATRRVLNQLERQVRTDLRELDRTLESLARDTALDVFPFDSAMLERFSSLSLQKLDLSPFDQAVLAAILVRSELLRTEGAGKFAFCELDADLQPWDKHGSRKEPLAGFYEAAGVWVYTDFVLKTPRRPERWFGALRKGYGSVQAENGPQLVVGKIGFRGGLRNSRGATHLAINPREISPPQTDEALSDDVRPEPYGSSHLFRFWT